MSEESNSTENNDTKNPMSIFVKLTVVSLAFTASVMFLFYNFAKFKNVDVGSLGGAFQGTFGVAAAVAGAIVTIQLAKIAIDQAKKSNDIADRQARNDDPDYQLTREIRNVITNIIFNHYVVVADLRANKGNPEKITQIGKKHADKIDELISSNAIVQLLIAADENSSSDALYDKYNGRVVPLKVLIDTFKIKEGSTEYFADYSEKTKNFFELLKTEIEQIKQNSKDNKFGIRKYADELFTASFIEKINAVYGRQ